MPYLPVTEAQLRTGQAACSLADLLHKAKALGHRQHGRDVEEGPALQQVFLKHSPVSPAQGCVHFPCNDREDDGYLFNLNVICLILIFLGEHRGNFACRRECNLMVVNDKPSRVPMNA